MSTPEQEIEYRQHRFTPPSGATEIFLVRHGESAAKPGPAPRSTWSTARPTRTSRRRAATTPGASATGWPVSASTRST